jgi:hypothetical protein
MRLPCFSPSRLRNSLGNATCPLEVTVASTVKGEFREGMGIITPPYRIEPASNHGETFAFAPKSQYFSHIKGQTTSYWIFLPTFPKNRR